MHLHVYIFLLETSETSHYIKEEQKNNSKWTGQFVLNDYKVKYSVILF